MPESFRVAKVRFELYAIEAIVAIDAVEPIEIIETIVTIEKSSDSLQSAFPQSCHPYRVVI